MNIREYLSKIISIFNQHEIEDVQVYYENNKIKYINVENSNIETFETVDAGGINVGGNYNGFHACTYIEKYDDKSIVEAANYIKQIAPLNKQPAVTKNLKSEAKKDNIEDSIHNVDLNEIIDTLIETEKKAKKIDMRVQKVTECSFNYVSKSIILMDNNLNMLNDSYSYCSGTVSVIANDGEIKNNATKSQIKCSYKELDFEAIAILAVNDAVSGLKATPIKSGEYSVLLRNNVFADIIAGFLPIFKLDNAKKGLSKFQDCTGKKAGNANLKIYEDPQYYNGKLKRSFDDEGNSIHKKYIINNGILENLLFSEDESGKTSGNAFRQSYKDKIGTSTTNCIVTGGEKTDKEIISSINEGIMICELGGLNAGINTVTGDFSLISGGFYIQNGKIIRPVNQITVGGNIYDLFYNIKDISSDMSSSSLYSSFVEAPSVLIDKLNIGGL